ncbi:helix-turn-helix domain-containing protein [Streptomyces sp. NPDC058625]|uniref:helix-turn-helix domain-containing protein n=1 Tax=Streptomyces sp. NPDC058625 TaxID=3346564 RepID=UPI00365E82F3
MSEPAFDEDFDVISSDGPLPFTMVPEWITYSGVKSAHRELWTVLASCVNHGRKDNRVWPTQAELADAMGLKKPDQLKPYRESLEAIGAVVLTEKRYQGGMRRRYVYDIRFRPPQGYDGPLTRQEWLARRNARLAAAAQAEQSDTEAFELEATGHRGAPKNGGTGAPEYGGARPARNGGARTPDNGGAKPDQHQPDQRERQTAPSARSAGNGRRPSAGSSTREMSSGSAAANGAEAQNHRSVRSGREGQLVTKEVQVVLEAFPDTLSEALRGTARFNWPKTLLKAIEQQLADGGLVQARRLGGRVARRWVTHGYMEHHTAGTLTSPIGAAVAMLKPGPCPDPRCEDGEFFDDGSLCRACIERDKNRRADRERDRKAAAAEKEAEARRRACPHCKEDRGTVGQPCEKCLRVLASTERDTAALIDQALTYYLARAGKEGDQAAAADFREYLTAEVARARRLAVAEGAEVLGQALAARLAADALARKYRASRNQPGAQGREAVLAERAERPAPEGHAVISPRTSLHDRWCPGPDGTGCPESRHAVGYDGGGLCVRCRSMWLNLDPPRNA